MKNCSIVDQYGFGNGFKAVLFVCFNLIYQEKAGMSTSYKTNHTVFCRASGPRYLVTKKKNKEPMRAPYNFWAFHLVHEGSRLWASPTVGTTSWPPLCPLQCPQLNWGQWNHNGQYHKGVISEDISCSVYRPLGMATSDMVRPMLWWIWMSSVMRSWGKSRNVAARSLFPTNTS